MVTQIPLPQPFKKVTKNSLTLSIKTLRNLVKRIFFHKDYEKTLRPTYGDAAKADDLVVEGGEVK